MNCGQQDRAGGRRRKHANHGPPPPPGLRKRPPSTIRAETGGYFIVPRVKVFLSPGEGLDMNCQVCVLFVQQQEVNTVAMETDLSYTLSIARRASRGENVASYVASRRLTPRFCPGVTVKSSLSQENTNRLTNIRSHTTAPLSAS